MRYAKPSFERRVGVGFALVVASLIVAAQVSAGDSDPRDWIRPDTFEAGAVGLLANFRAGHRPELDSLCSVALVGLNYAVTARHCVAVEEENQGLFLSPSIVPDSGQAELLHGRTVAVDPEKPPMVMVGVVNGIATQTFQVEEVWQSNKSGWAAQLDDWAILKLGRSRKDLKLLREKHSSEDGARYPGQIFQTFEVGSPAVEARLPLKVRRAGFDADFYSLPAHPGFTAIVRDCTAFKDQLTIAMNSGSTELSGDYLQTDCFGSSGGSGGPVWEQGTRNLVGIFAAVPVSPETKSRLLDHGPDSPMRGLDWVVSADAFMPTLVSLQR